MKKKVAGIILLAVVLAAGIWSMQAYHTMKIDQMRADGVKTLKASVDLKEYGKKEQKKIRKIMRGEKEEIMRSTDRDEIAVIAAGLGEKIEGIPTIAERQAKGVKSLKKLVSLKDYRDAQQDEIKDIRKAARKKIRKATEKKQIRKIVKDAGEQIALIKTDAQLTAEEEAARLAAIARARAAAAARSRHSSSSSHSKKKNSGGCVGKDKKNFY